MSYLALFNLGSSVTCNINFDTSKKSDLQLGILNKTEYSYKLMLLFSVSFLGELPSFLSMKAGSRISITFIGSLYCKTAQICSRVGKGLLSPQTVYKLYALCCVSVWPCSLLAKHQVPMFPSREYVGLESIQLNKKLDL